MALIVCSECGKKVSDKAKVCVNCGCPIENEKKEDVKKFNFTKEQLKVNKKHLIIIPLFISFVIFLLMLEMTFDNFFISIFSVAIYWGIVLLMYNCLIKDKIYIKTLDKSLMICGLVVPIIVVIFMFTSSEEWSYNDYSSYYSEMEYYSLDLNIFGQCYYYYSNLEEDIRKTTSKCSYKKNDDKYTFYVTEKGTDEEVSFDCMLTDGQLKCPLQYTYPRRYLYLERD